MIMDVNVPTKNEVLAHATSFIAELKEFARSKFDLNLPTFTPTIKFTNANQLGLAGRRDGQPFMMVNFGHIIKYPVLAYDEYKRLAPKASIGSFYTNDWKLWVEALILHEFAHVIQFNIITSKSKLKLSQNVIDGYGIFETGHGRFFQRIYKTLRDKFLNHKIRPSYCHIGKQFDMPKTDRPVNKSTVTTEHPLMGVRISLHSQVFTVVGYDKRKYKYPFIVQSDAGQKFRVSEKYVKSFVI